MCSVYMNPSKMHLLQKKTLYEEGQIQTPELLSSDDLCTYRRVSHILGSDRVTLSYFMLHVSLRWGEDFCGPQRTGGERRAGLSSCSTTLTARSASPRRQQGHINFHHGACRKQPSHAVTQTCAESISSSLLNPNCSCGVDTWLKPIFLSTTLM